MSAFDAFTTVHEFQLAAIPKELWLPLFMKLGEDYLDAGSAVELHYGDPLEGYSLHTKADVTLKKHSEVYLIDHAWTTSPENAKKELSQTLPLLERLENLMDIEKEELEDSEDEDDTFAHDDETVHLVAEQANVSFEKAKEALDAKNNDVISAIMHLTMDEDFEKESKRLEDQVIGQMMESGTPQAKDEKEKKEKAERRAKREKEWIQRRVDAVYTAMWSYLQTYSYSILQLDGQPETQAAWYINDEVGSALCHASDPNVACVPFIFSGAQGKMIPYSVMFPIKDIEAGEILTCDLVPKNLTRSIDQHAYLFALGDRILPSENLNEKRKEIIDAFKAHQTRLSQIRLEKTDRITDSDQAMSLLKEKAVKTSDDSEVRVFTKTEFVRNFLTVPDVKWVDSEEKADIIWSSQDIHDWQQLKSSQKVNQFENESCLTFKHHLAALIRKTYGAPAWLPTTYNLVTELGEFVGDFLVSEETETKNLWITKPWNHDRGLGIAIQKTLPELIRQHDSPTPKIAQRYLTRPCLYNGKKFDLQYIVLLRHISPTMVACVYNMFWIRLANKKFNLDDLDDHERQFTVTNHSDFQMTQLDYKSFIYHIEKEHKVEWKEVQANINQAMKDVLAAAATRSQPLGLQPEKEPSYDSFSVFGFDVMLTDDFKPVILEANFSPDCTRACKYDNEFVNNIFSVVEGRLNSIDKGLQAFTML